MRVIDEHTVQLSNKECATILEHVEYLVECLKARQKGKPTKMQNAMVRRIVFLLTGESL